jgi:hypothetical protein
VSVDEEDPRFPGQRFTVPTAGLWKMTASLPLGRAGRSRIVEWRPRRRRRVVDVYLPGDWPPDPTDTQTAVTFEEETDL